MSDAIDVQPVEDNANSTEPHNTYIEEKAFNVTLPITMDTAMPTVYEEAVPVQPKAKQRGGRQKKSDVPDLKEKVTCPECSKTVSLHSLKFTHKKYCKAQKVEVVDMTNNSLPHEHLEVHNTAQPEVHYVQYDPGQVVAQYVTELKHNKKQARQSKYKQLLAGRI